MPNLEVEVRENIALNPNFRRYIQNILRFTKREAEVRKQALPFVPTHYIRTFDVISEVICVLLRRMKNKRSHLSQHAISELLKRFPYMCALTLS